MRIYLSHPYGGNPKNREESRRIREFYQMTWKYERKEHKIVNPLEALEKFAGKFSEEVILGLAVHMMKQCDAVLFCQGWEKSHGCRTEYETAKRIGMKIYYLDKLEEEMMVG